MLLTRGFGSPQAVLTRGLGGRTAQTAHFSTFNTPTLDPSVLPINHRGQEGDLEYGVMNTDLESPYNSRSLQVFLPVGVTLSPRSIARIRNWVRDTRISTENIRVIDGDSGAIVIQLLGTELV